MLANEQVQWKLEKRAQRFTNKMKQHICNKLRTEQWSPQQIVEDCRNRGLRMVGITTIYKYLHKDKKEGGDLIIGKGGKEAILTLVDRLTGYLIIERPPQGKNAKSLAKTLIKRIRPQRNRIKRLLKI